MLTRQLLLNRKKIDAELNNLFHYPLTVVVAAMGYGKTTAVRCFLNNRKADFIWLAVESDEASPQYLWDSLTRQLIKTKPELGEQLRALGFPVDAAQREKIKNIIEDHTYRTNTVLVIDDYHFAHSPALDRFIESIVKSEIESFHILVLSRTLPEFGVDELMLKGYCYLIKNAFFELTCEEIQDYFKLYGYALAPDTAQLVYDRSEGWISAVYLMLQKYADTGRLETGKSLERLIDTSVMPRYTDQEITLLKSLCVFDSITPQQAVYVTCDESAMSILYKLSLENFFIRYDEDSGSFKIHNIFSDYLKRQLEVQPPGLELEKLYERYGSWSIENGNILSGVKYLLRAKKFDLVLNEFESSRMTKIVDSNPDIILEIFEQIPCEARYRHPIGLIAYIGFYVTNVDRQVGERLLTETEMYYKNDENLSPALMKRISGEIELIRGYSAFNDVSLMLNKFKKAHKLLDGRSYIANKDKIVTFGSPHILYLYYSKPGYLLRTVEGLEELYPYYGEVSGGCGVGFEHQIRAEYCLETGKPDDAELLAYKTIYKARTLDQLSVIICANLTLARIFAVRGQFDEALDIMDNLSMDVEAGNSTILSSTLDLCIGYIEGIRGEESGFANWLRNGDIKQSEVLYQGLGFNYIVYGKYLLLKKSFIELEVLCEEMRRIVSPFYNLLGILHSYILESIARYNLYGTEEAIPSILSAIEIGRADGVVLPFAEYGQSILKVLEALKDTRENQYLNDLLESVKQYAANQRKRAKKDSAILLTEREQEILRLLAGGKINREIALELFIAEVTVRKTITSIYRKLDVSGRATAVRKAMELNLI